jgi:glycerate kinase
LGFGLRALCGAESVSGAGLLIEITEMEKVLDEADVLITGEGCTDSQTANGKLCAVIAESAAKHAVPAILVSGALKGDLSGLDSLFTAMFSTTVLPCSLDEALAATPANLVRIGRSIAGVLSV